MAAGHIESIVRDQGVTNAVLSESSHFYSVQDTDSWSGSVYSYSLPSLVNINVADVP